jgi:hypothetical protein
MFNLSASDLGLRILGCADGPASFNSQIYGLGHRVVSCDPLYAFSEDEIRRRVGATSEILVELARKNQDRFLWDRFKSPEDLGRFRLAAMEEFVADFKQGKSQGRYLNCSLPRLQLDADSFDLALCSHFLFLYSDEFSLEFHIASVREMCRVAKEARIFPLLDMRGGTSIHLEPLVDRINASGLICEIVIVPYEFQRGGNRMLQIRRRD